MNVNSSLQAMIAELGARMGLHSLRLDDDGACALKFDGRLRVDIQYRPESEALIFYSDLGPPAAGEAFYLRILRANLFWRETYGTTLSLSDDNPAHVVIAKIMDWRSLDSVSLREAIETFVDAVEEWANRVEGLMKDEDKKEDEGNISNALIESESAFIRI